ncbi:restriction endonuclease [Chlorella virus XW01]|nr:restriction endonuclease [Chlorella virus XW01]
MYFFNIMSKDYLGFFHKIHCILRDGEIGLTGLNALNEINNMVLIVFMEQYIKKYNLDEEFKFSYIYNKCIVPYLKTNIKTEQNKKLDIIISKYNNLLMELHQNEYTKKYIFSDTNKVSAFFSLSNLNGAEADFTTYFNAIRQLVELFVACKKFFYEDNNDEILISEEDVKNVMNSIDYDILGDAYEKFKEDEVGNQGKNVGQYFTPRTVIKFMVEELVKPKYNEKCYDSSCGTGGFFHYLNKYIHNNFTDKQHKEFKNNMYGNDKTAEIIKSLYINLFLHDIPVKNITNRNSLNDVNCWNQFERFDIIVGNPPFGMSIKSDPRKYIKYFDDKPYNYFPKFMHSKKDQTITDSMGQFMIHTINSLKVGGRFCLVVDRGILNNGTEGNSWQKSLRQWMLSVCDLNKIILLPKGIFTHTQFDTAIIYGEKKIGYLDSQVLPKPFTKNVNIYYGKFEDEKNKKGIIIDLNKPDLTLSIKDIVNHNWSLNYDNYVEKTEDLHEGVQYKTLGEVCEFNIGGTPDTKNPIYWNGNNLWVSISDLNNNIVNNTERKITNEGVKKSNVKLIKKGSIMFSFKLTIGKMGIAGSDMYCNEAIAFFTNLKNISDKYLIYILKCTNFEKQKHLFNSQIGKSLNKTTLGKVKIPILPQDLQNSIVKNVNEIIGNDYGLLDRMVEEFKEIDIFKILMFENYDTFNYMTYITRQLINYDKYKKEIFNIRKRNVFTFYKDKSKEMKLGEVVNKINTGKHIGINNMMEKKYPYYGANGIIRYVDTYLFNGLNDILCAQDGSIGATHLVSGLYNASNHVWIINQKNKKTNNIYLYYHLKYNVNYLKPNIISGQAIPKLTKNKLLSLIIQVPSLKDQEEIVKVIDQIDKEEIDYLNKISNMKKEIEQLYLIMEKQEPIINDNNYEDDEDIEDQDEEQEYEEIEYKGKTLILDGENLYKKIEDIENEKIYGKYVDSKVIKNKIKIDKVIDI